MKWIHTFCQDIKRNILFYILSFCLISSSIVVIPNGIVFYIGGLFILLYKGYAMGKYSSNGKLFLALSIACFLSSLVNDIWDYRLLIFILLLIACTPVIDSEQIFVFRGKYLFYSLIIFPFLSMAAIYCFFAGINMYTPDVSNFKYGISGYDFSAFYNHPMWLAASVGLANVVYTWLFFQTPKTIYKIVIFVGLFFSIMISFVSGSRSALIASIVAMYSLVLLMSENTKKIITYTLYVGVIAVILMPFYMNYSQRMVMKMEAGKGQIYGSRTEIFVSGFAHFWDNPLFGSGFATQWRNGRFYVGRFESGSGWLSILFQLGIVGTVIVGVILAKVRKAIKYMQYDKRLILYFSCFVFLCAHSCFEGYILTSGYYLCILFWMLLGHLTCYPYHKIRRANRFKSSSKYS